jgi:hypothetical protein
VPARHKSFLAVARLSQRLVRALLASDWRAWPELRVPTVAAQRGLALANLPAAMLGAPFGCEPHLSRPQWEALRAAHQGSHLLFNPVI